MQIVKPIVGHGKGIEIDNSNFVDFKSPIRKYRNGFLPHWEQEGVIQFITLRLNDSLPEFKLKELLDFKMKLQSIEDEIERMNERLKSIDYWLDRGNGECLLKYDEIQRLIVNCLNFYDGFLYYLFDYVVMPNHLHFLMIPIECVENIMARIKSYTTVQMNKILKRKGKIWQTEYFDRMMRNLGDFATTAEYIKGNPIGLKK